MNQDVSHPSPASVVASSTSPAAAGHGGGSGTTLAALGVVFGDIGTSPLYAFKEALHASGQSAEAALGIASLVFWVVLLVVGVKYVLLVMSADNEGEGSTIVLLSLALPAAPERWRSDGA